MNPSRFLIAGLMAAPLLSACASTPAVRTLASNTGIFVQSLNEGTADFVTNQNQLNAANEERLTSLDRSGTNSRAQVRRQRMVWTDRGERARLATHDLATGTSAVEVVAGLQGVVERQPARLENGTTTGYRAALEALADASRVPTESSIFAEAFTYGRQILGGYEELRQAAESSGNQAGAAGGTADQAALANPTASAPQSH